MPGQRRLATSRLRVPNLDGVVATAMTCTSYECLSIIWISFYHMTWRPCPRGGAYMHACLYGREKFIWWRGIHIKERYSYGKMTFIWMFIHMNAYSYECLSTMWMSLCCTNTSPSHECLSILHNLAADWVYECLSIIRTTLYHMNASPFNEHPSIPSRCWLSICTSDVCAFASVWMHAYVCVLGRYRNDIWRALALSYRWERVLALFYKWERLLALSYLWACAVWDAYDS